MEHIIAGRDGITSQGLHNLQRTKLKFGVRDAQPLRSGPPFVGIKVKEGPTLKLAASQLVVGGSTFARYEDVRTAVKAPSSVEPNKEGVLG